MSARSLAVVCVVGAAALLTFQVLPVSAQAIPASGSGVVQSGTSRCLNFTKTGAYRICLNTATNGWTITGGTDISLPSGASLTTSGLIGTSQKFYSTAASGATAYQTLAGAKICFDGNTAVNCLSNINSAHTFSGTAFTGAVGVKMGFGGTTIRDNPSGTVTHDFNVSAGSCADTDEFSAPGAVDGSVCTVGAPASALVTNAEYKCYASASNKAKVRMCCASGGSSCNPASSAFNVMFFVKSGSTSGGTVDWLGDSITEGFYTPGFDPPGVLRNSIAQGVNNYGVSGNTVSQMRTRWTNTVRGSGSNHLILLGGVNDLKVGTSAATIWNDYEVIVDQALSDGRRVILLTVLPWKNYTGGGWSASAQTQTEALNTLILTKCANTAADCVDTYAHFGGQGGDAALIQTQWDQGDHLHLGNLGSIELASYVVSEAF